MMLGNLKSVTRVRTRDVNIFHWSLLAAILLMQLLIAKTADAQGLSFVNGYVAVPVKTKENKRKEIALPGAHVFLVDQKTGDKIASTTSDLSGRFNLKTNRPGVFQVCVFAEGFGDRCSRKEFELNKSSHRFGTFLLPLPRRESGAAHAWGKVELRDGSTPRTFDPYMSVNSFGVVEMQSNGATKHKAYINNFNEYVIPEIPVGENFDLKVVVEKEEFTRRIDKESLLQPNRDYSFDFTLSNAPPELRMLSAMFNGKPLQEVPAGKEVEVVAVAQDIDGDKISYRWRMPEGTVVGPSNQSSIKWRAPSRKGRYEVSVLIGDDRGGYSRRSVAIDVGDNRIPFTGQVVNVQGQPIVGALVDINGRLFSTNTKGRLRAEVPLADRYVFTIRKDGVTSNDLDAYGTVSYIYQGAVRSGRWVLRRAQLFSIDPTKPIVLRQSAKYRDCVPPRSAQIDWKNFNNSRLFQWQDGRGQMRPINEVAATDKERIKRVTPLIKALDASLRKVFQSATQTAARDPDRLDRREREPKDDERNEEVRCGPGIKVEIPANSLVDQTSGDMPAGKLRLALSSVEVNTSQMPGDWTASDENSTEVSMESFGAGSIEIGDGFRRFNLAPGKEATVSIPIDRSQLAGGATLDPKIPFLYFNEATGVWEQDGMAVLVGSGSTAVYQRKVKHFSNVNADILKQGESCVAVEYDAAAGFSAPLDIEIIMQPSVVNPTVNQVRTVTRTDLDTFAIYNLPNNSDIAITPIIDGIQPDGSAGPVPAGVFIVNTGGPQTSATNNPTANPDGSFYSESGGVATGPCGSRVVLTNLPAPVPDSGYEFLQGVFLQYSSNFTALELNPAFDANELVLGALDYYTHADPRDKRNSYNLFLSENDFGEPFDAGEVEWNAEFANSGDLGFGRDMHCRRNNGDDGQFDYACYVTNYGQPPLDLPDQDDADNAHAGVSPDATVAMEYSRVENPAGDPVEFPDNGRAVKFYVFNTNAPDAEPITKADLDNFGERPIPQLCVICHGGQTAAVALDPDNPTGPTKGAFIDRVDIMNMNSSFLPFDLGLYNFPVSNGKAAQEPSFKGLNEDIVLGVATANDAAGNPGAEIIELIDEFYDGGALADQVGEPVVDDWDKANPASDINQLYRDVFGPTCRTCHIAQPYAAPPYGREIDFRNDIVAIQSRVCNQKVMPHAKRTNEIFWNSLNPNMPSFLQLYGQAQAGWLDTPDSQCGQFYQAGTSVVSIYATEIQPIFASRCASCHSAGGPASFTNFIVGTTQDTYDDLISTGLIIPSDLSSPLFERLDGIGGGLMPQGGPDLETQDEDGDGVNDQDEIEAWILLGAPGP